MSRTRSTREDHRQQRTSDSAMETSLPLAMRVCSPGGVVDNAANRALTLWVGSSGIPDSTAHALATAGPLWGPLRRRQHSSGLARSSLACCDRNASGGNHKEFVRTRRDRHPKPSTKATMQSHALSSSFLFLRQATNTVGSLLH